MLKPGGRTDTITAVKKALTLPLFILGLTVVFLAVFSVLSLLAVWGAYAEAGSSAARLAVSLAPLSVRAALPGAILCALVFAFVRIARDPPPRFPSFVLCLGTVFALLHFGILGLTALAQGGEVVVSRGEAVEIGGGFRIPDVMRQSGAVLVEVGTTNRTYTSDYEAAIGDETVALLKVHASNFRITGFTHSPDIEEMVALGRRHGLIVLHDLGSGCLLETRDYGLTHEPTPQESIAAGVDVADRFQEFLAENHLSSHMQASARKGK